MITKGPRTCLDHTVSMGNDCTKYALPGAGPDAPGQFHSLEHGPGETTKPYREHAEIVEELRTQLHAHCEAGRGRP